MVGKEAQPSGEPRTTQTNQRQEQREGQPRSRVWDVLERKVLLHAPDAKNDLQKYPKIWLERASVVNRQEEVLRKNGSDYDKAVLAIYDKQYPRSLRQNSRQRKTAMQLLLQSEATYLFASNFGVAADTVTHPFPGTARTLTLEQFQHFQADFRELSVQELAEQKRQLLQEMQQL